MGNVYFVYGESASTGEHTRKVTPVVITGCTDRLLAQSWAFGALPKTLANGNYGMLWLRNVDVREKQGAIDTWEGEGEYLPIPPIDMEMTWEFDTTAESAHITQSRETTAVYAPAGQTPPNLGGAIGVTMDSVEGCDILVPKLEWVESWRLPRVSIGGFAASALFATMTGRTNLYAFRGFPPASVLLQGVTARWCTKSAAHIDLQYKFRVGQALVNLTAGDITGINKGYWEYLWYKYRQEADVGDQSCNYRPTAAYVERVYDSCDFAGLCIPTGIPLY